MNIVALLAKINKKADENHKHEILEIEGLKLIQNEEIDSIVNDALNKREE